MSNSVSPGYTDEVRLLAEAVRAGRADPHHVAETIRDLCAAIDEMNHRIDMADIFLAGLGEFERFEKVFNEIGANQDEH